MPYSHFILFSHFINFKRQDLVQQRLNQTTPKCLQFFILYCIYVTFLTKRNILEFKKGLHCIGKNALFKTTYILF